MHRLKRVEASGVGLTTACMGLGVSAVNRRISFMLEFHFQYLTTHCLHYRTDPLCTKPRYILFRRPICLFWQRVAFINLDADCLNVHH